MLTLDQVIALAPDAASVKAGRALASPGKWNSLGTNDEAIWGLAQGSGKKPYLTQVHLPEPAFKCSCPSRKFPCKHALGLLFIAANSPTSLSENTPPEWVAEWLKSRSDRQQKQTTREKTSPDTKAAAKRKEKKHNRINEGVEHLEQVLCDIYRNGLTNLGHDHDNTWETLAKRMIDAQAPGLAGQVRHLGNLLNTPQWETPFIHATGSLYLLLQAWKKRDTLKLGLRSEIEQLIGLSPSKEDVLKNTPVTDHWFVASRKFSETDRLGLCQTWLYGNNTGKWAKKLTFSPLPKKPHDPWPLGTLVNTSLSYYPGTTQFRALPTNEHATSKILTNHSSLQNPEASFSRFLEEYADCRSKNPWHRHHPLLLPLTPHQHKGQNILIDNKDFALPWKTTLTQEQLFVSISGSRPTLCCVEWNGFHLKLLSTLSDQQWIDCP